MAGQSVVKPASAALPEAGGSELGRRAAALAADHAGASGYCLIHEGIDGLALRVQLIRRAERSLDLQYFIFRGDETGTLIREELRRAADRGVRVRVLVDDGDTVPGDEKLLELDGHPNIEVWVFNPFDTRSHRALLRNLDFVLHKSRLDYRMHNKLLIADDAVAITGGRNIGNQYFQVDPASQFADDELFVVGPMVRQLSQEFDEFWNSDMSVPARSLGGLPAYQPPPLTQVPAEGADYLSRIASGEPYGGLSSGAAPLAWSDARLVYDSPDKRFIEQRQQRGRLMSEAVERELGGAKTEVLIVSPYFVPSDRELSLLQGLSEDGAAVKVLTNSLEAAPSLAAQSGYDKLREPLIRSGVELFEARAHLDSVKGSGQTRRVSSYGHYALHAKLYVFDRRRCFIGSWNYDRRSLRINTEMGLLLDDPGIAAEVAGRFDAMTGPGAAYRVRLKDAGSNDLGLVWETEIDHQRVQLFKEPSRGWGQRVKERLIGLLPLQPEL